LKKEKTSWGELHWEKPFKKIILLDLRRPSLQINSWGELHSPTQFKECFSHCTSMYVTSTLHFLYWPSGQLTRYCKLYNEIYGLIITGKLKIISEKKGK
jgi:hypothetical protein